MTLNIKNIFPHICRLAALALLVTAIGCSGSRHAASDTAGQASDLVSPRTVTLTGIADSYLSWQDLSVPVRIALRQPASVTLSGRLTMVRDESIHLSFKMLGIEVASAYLDRDSAFVYERLHKYLLAEPMDRITGRTSLSLADMQDIILARICAPGTGTLKSSNTAAFSLTGTDNGTLITPLGTRNYSLTFLMKPGIPPLPEILTVDIPSAGKSTISYADWTATSAGTNPQRLELNGRLSGKPLDATVTLDYEQARWNTAPKNKWSVPRKATRISIVALAEMLKHM